MGPRTHMRHAATLPLPGNPFSSSLSNSCTDMGGGEEAEEPRAQAHTNVTRLLPPTAALCTNALPSLSHTTVSMPVAQLIPPPCHSHPCPCECPPVLVFGDNHMRRNKPVYTGIWALIPRSGASGSNCVCFVRTPCSLCRPLLGVPFPPHCHTVTSSTRGAPSRACNTAAYAAIKHVSTSHHVNAVIVQQEAMATLLPHK